MKNILKILAAILLILVLFSLSSLVDKSLLQPNLSIWLVLLAKSLSGFGKDLNDLITSWPSVLFVLLLVFFINHRAAINELIGRIEGGTLSLGELKATFEAKHKERVGFDIKTYTQGKRCIIGSNFRPKTL